MTFKKLFRRAFPTLFNAFISFSESQLISGHSLTMKFFWSLDATMISHRKFNNAIEIHLCEKGRPRQGRGAACWSQRRHFKRFESRKLFPLDFTNPIRLLKLFGWNWNTTNLIWPCQLAILLLKPVEGSTRELNISRAVSVAWSLHCTFIFRLLIVAWGLSMIHLITTKANPKIFAPPSASCPADEMPISYQWGLFW